MILFQNFKRYSNQLSEAFPEPVIVMMIMIIMIAIVVILLILGRWQKSYE